MVRLMPNISIPSMGALHQGGKMAFHVDPSSLIYSHFEHVSGIAAPEGINGISISKLNLIDVLIGQLNQVKKGNTTFLQAAAGPENADAIMENISNLIRQARSESMAMPYIPSPSAEGGAVFSIFA